MYKTMFSLHALGMALALGLGAWLSAPTARVAAIAEASPKSYR